MWMPFTTRKIWCTGRLRSLSGFGATSTGQLSEPTRGGSCFARHSSGETPTPGCVEDHRVARLQFHPALLGERLLQVVGGDLVGIAEHLHGLQRRDVDQHA